VLALAVARLMRREAAKAGLDMSVRELLSTLGEIEETVLLYQGYRGRLRAWRMLTEMDPTQVRLYDLFGLAAHAPIRRVRYNTGHHPGPALTWTNGALTRDSPETPARSARIPGRSRVGATDASAAM
jgi:hypothetical protein